MQTLQKPTKMPLEPEQKLMSDVSVSSPYTTKLPLSSTETPHIEIFRIANQQVQLGNQEQSSFKLLFLEDGEGWYQVNHRKIPVVPGDVFLILPDEIHDLSGLENTKTWVVVFESQALVPSKTDTDIFLVQPYEMLHLSSLSSKSIDNRYFQTAPTDRPRWLARLHQLERELHDKSSEFLESARVLLLLLIIDVVKLGDTQLKKSVKHGKPLLKKVFDFIESNYCNPISLLDVAKAVNLSSGYLTQIVRRETGLTVLSWILERRMLEARRLLLVSDQSVQEIAKGVGYLDTGHFIRQFRRDHGNTPQAWRRVHQTIS